ncbi:MAG TPA: hypothetical protein VE646_11025, partial [Actinomycetota bacterium]|nr:hypothetical protein [Actinomycetota bacterium]
AVPAFTLAMVHGVFAGTDTARPWMWWTYLATGLIALFLVLVRGLTAGERPQRAPRPAHAPARPAPTPARRAPQHEASRTPPVAPVEVRVEG